MTALPFDGVSIQQDGKTVRLSADEFLGLPFAARVELILARVVQFYAGSLPVDRQVALQRLRQLAQNSDSETLPRLATASPVPPENLAPTDHFLVDGSSFKAVLYVRLWGVVTPPLMREFVMAHNAAVDAFRAEPYHVFGDIRELQPLSPESAWHFERAKAYSAARPNFRGSAVLCASSLVSMQNRRTSVMSGVADTELVSDDEDACWAHIKCVQRGRG